MEYKNIIKEIDNLNAIDFTMSSFETVSILSRTINNIYSSSMLNNKTDAKAKYETARGYLCSTLFDILKNKLGFEDEVINQIVSLIDFIDIVQEIYVIDDIVMIKMQTGMENNNIITSFIPKDNFIDVTSRTFINGLDLDVYKDYFINAFNEASSEKLLIKENEMITYNQENVSIYLDKPLKSIMQVNSDVIGEKFKVIIEKDDEINYYDMMVHYGHFDLVQKDFTVNKISLMLNAKGKTKKLHNK